MSNLAPHRLITRALDLLDLQSPPGRDVDGEAPLAGAQVGVELANLIERWALECPQISPDDVLRRGNSLVIGQPDGRRPCVGLVAHLGGGTFGHADGEMIVGPGGQAATSIALLMTLVDTLELAGLALQPILIFHDGEPTQHASNGLARLLSDIETLKSLDLAVVLEPTENIVFVGCLGVLRTHLIFENTSNAIHAAAKCLTAIAEQGTRQVEVAGVIFNESIQVIQAQAQSPAMFDLLVDVRHAPSNIAGALGELPGVVRTVRAEGGAPAGVVAVDNPIVQKLLQGGGMSAAAHPGWSQAAQFSACGVDAIALGPGDTRGVSFQALGLGFETLRRMLVGGF